MSIHTSTLRENNKGQFPEEKKETRINVKKTSSPSVPVPTGPSLHHYESFYCRENRKDRFLSTILRGKWENKSLQTISTDSMDIDVGIIKTNFSQIAKSFEKLKKDDSITISLPELDSAIHLSMQNGQKIIKILRAGEERVFGIHEGQENKGACLYPIEGKGMIQILGKDLQTLVKGYLSQSSCVSFVAYISERRVE